LRIISILFINYLELKELITTAATWVQSLIFIKIWTNQRIFFNYQGLSPKKRNKILDSNQYIYIYESCCGYDYNLAKHYGHMRTTESYKARSNYRELTLHNGICKSSVEILGNKIVHTQNGRKHIVTVREFFDDRMKTTRTVDSSVVLVKHYVAIGKHWRSLFKFK